MIAFQPVKGKENIYNNLNNFLVCFPELLNRVNDLDQYSIKLSENGNVFILKQNQESVGFVALYSNDIIDHVGYITLIGILPSYRRSGYGSLLLSNAIEFMKQSGMTKVKLEVDVDNVGAIQYYLKNGFTIVSNARNTSFYMLKNIS